MSKRFNIITHNQGMVIKYPEGLALVSLKKILQLRLRLVVVIAIVILAFFLGLIAGRFNIPGGVLKASINQVRSIDGINITVTEAQFTNSIKLADQSAQAPAGKKFLVIFTEPENASTSAKQVAYGNWFRLEENGKKFAPLPINNTFVIPPTATLDKQLVFVVDADKRKFNLQVGDLDKDKKNININF